MKNFSQLESVSKERIKKQQVGKWQDYKFISSRSKKKSANERCEKWSEVKNAILCLNMKNFSQLESVSKERIKKQQVGKWQDYKFISSRSKKKSANERCHGS